MSLEKIVRPFQSSVAPVRVNPTATPSPNIIVRYGESGPANAVDSNGDKVKKVLTGSLNFSATVYNKKHPKEKKTGSNIRGVDLIEAGLNAFQNAFKSFF